MKFALLCRVRPDSLPMLRSLRAQHLDYIDRHKDSVLFGGPTRDENGIPHTMIILLDVADAAAAADFVRGEPYTASGQVFESVTVQPWSQVLPEGTPGELRREIEQEQQRSNS